MSTKSLVITAAIAAALLGIVIYGFGGSAGPGNSATSTPSSSAEVKEVRVERPNLVVLAKGAARVELWLVPTGTGVTERDHTKIGDAKKAGSEGDYDTWTYQIPASQFLATRVFAKAFALDGSVAEASLPEAGATSIYEALWGKAAATSTGGTVTPVSNSGDSRTLAVGESASYDGLFVTVRKVTEDSRCAADVQCVWAGQVQVQVELSANSQSETKTISSLVRDFAYQDYHMAITDVKPANKPKEGEAYSITFRFWR